MKIPNGGKLWYKGRRKMEKLNKNSRSVGKNTRSVVGNEWKTQEVWLCGAHLDQTYSLPPSSP